MIDLNFQVEGAEPEHYAAAPLVVFKVRVTERMRPGRQPTSVQSIALNCQIRIEPARRRYDAKQQERLRDLFGTADRWSQTLRPLHWTNANVVIRPFVGTTVVDVPVACSYDFTLAATRYFDALEGGEIPLCFLFSGSIFFETDEYYLQVTQIPWDREAYFRLPAGTWKALMESYYPSGTWLCLRKDILDQLNVYRTRHGLPTLEHALEALLVPEREAAPQ